jgi:GTP-binding protein LepA
MEKGGCCEPRWYRLGAVRPCGPPCTPVPPVARSGRVRRPERSVEIPVSDRPDAPHPGPRGAVLRERIRNFCIVAHIDHGKSTLADRLIERTGALDPRAMQPQVLDSMDIERERGITIKAQAVRLTYTARDGHPYTLNLIDTPGHVDFHYEVSRALAACEGAVLVVDATQGVQAQTLANLYLALDHGLTVIPTINKIDLPSADIPAVREQLQNLGFLPEEILAVSAKAGLGIDELLEAIVTRVPPPAGDPDAPLRALVFDSAFDSYKGVVAYVRVVDGVLSVGQRIRLFASGQAYEVTELGVFRPAREPVDVLPTGSVGYLAAAIRRIADCRVGDTVTDDARPASEPLPGYRAAKPMVFAGVYPVEADDFDRLREALEKLQLNDAALSFEPETSAALGFGFRCGFLGLLHMDVVRERLEREYDLDLVVTAPSVRYRVTRTDGTVEEIDNPAKFPPRDRIAEIAEPVVRASIFTPSEYLGAILELCRERRGEQTGLEYVDPTRVRLEYKLPLAEIMFDFFDQLKSRSRGYATLDYEWLGYEPADVVKVDILVAGEPVDALSMVVHRSAAYARGRRLVERLRTLIPRQQFEVALQAAIGGKIIARENIPPLRKDVLAKCYGGDVTRKRKLLERQKEGKKRMKAVGSVDIPQEAFLAVLRVGED